jgi:hypothetical protein
VKNEILPSAQYHIVSFRSDISQNNFEQNSEISKVLSVAADPCGIELKVVSGVVICTYDYTHVPFVC